MFLWHLPDDVLYHILSYLDRKTLSRLSQVSKAIFHVVSRDIVWKRMAKDMLNTGITPNGTDLYPHILLKERVKRSLNWCAGVCKRDTPLKWKTKLLPWLQLDGDTLYLSQAADIRAYRLQQNCRRIQRKPVQIYSGHQADVCRFVLTDSHLISGGSDGKILVHSRRSHTSMQLSGHNQEINCIDSKDGLIVSGSRDQTTQIWSLASCCPKGVIPLYDRVWSVAINPALSSFVTGTACCENSTPLLVWDVERHSEVDLLVCFGSLSCCRTQVGFSLRSPTDGRTFSFKICLSTAEFMVPFVTASLPGPEVPKQPQTITLPPQYFTVGWSACALWVQSSAEGQVCWIWCLRRLFTSSPVAMTLLFDFGTFA
ncbi:F-box/WD repeat-containing protein 4 isoform X4 [Dunckerocampus dactyliophorus]|uniref:F-box/WD repeat-containing protein 4 isoform X4 n=1 Tax=Dunckerocampus dactyliophorus TaxID=161453 RepID=UPI002404B2CD|nr:F-box/WD repeat-containing protein 4 isoform X4 [Dunckerocampus dactyliophorus]